MDGKRDLYKLIRGKSFEEEVSRQIPSLESTLKRAIKASKSAHDLVKLGTGSDEDLWISEEERESHMHVIGSTGEGKSKFLEMLMRSDIDKGNGLLLLDPSNKAETAYKVLKYCCKVGHKKVILVDPKHHFKYNRVVALNPFDYHPSNREESVASLMDTMRILFGTYDAASTARISRYLAELISLLHKTKLTLHEASYFRRFGDEKIERQVIFNKALTADPYCEEVRELKEAFTNVTRYDKLFETTAGRLGPIFQSDYLNMALGTTEGLDFNKMVAEGWVILVNLARGNGLDQLGSRLLGTTVLNSILFAVDRLNDHGWKGKYYIYIDEAGRYTNRGVADILAHGRKSGLRVLLSHQWLGQFEDPYVSEAVINSAKIKVAFYMANPKDRMSVVQMLYGGELSDREVAYYLSNITKAHAVVKKGKDRPHTVEIPYTPDIEIPQKKLDAYISELYQAPWYMHPETIKKSWSERIGHAPEVPEEHREERRHKTTSRLPRPGNVKTAGSARVPPAEPSGWDDVPSVNKKPRKS